jgi:hypothetical protein
MKAVLDNIAASLERQPREVWMIYYNPATDLTKMAPFFRKVRSRKSRPGIHAYDVYQHAAE